MPSPAHPYVCASCGAHGLKLWRESYVWLDRVRLLCCYCTGREEGEDVLSTRPDGLRDGKYGQTDQIGSWLPAVPTPGGSFWGYTSIPEDACQWWRALRNWRYSGQAQVIRTATGSWTVRGLVNGRQLPRRRYRTRVLAAAALVRLHG